MIFPLRNALTIWSLLCFHSNFKFVFACLLAFFHFCEEQKNRKNQGNNASFWKEKQNWQAYSQNDQNKRSQIYKMWDENEDTPADTNVVHKILSTHLKNLNSNNLVKSIRTGWVTGFIWLVKVKWKLNKQSKQIYNKQ